MKRLLLYLFLFCFANAVFAQQEITIHLETAGTLASKLGDNKDKITTLHVSGSLNGDDLVTINGMLMLHYLDMGNVSDLPEDYIGPETFKGNLHLKEIVFPPIIKSIYAQTFSGCNNLSKIYLDNVENLELIGFGAFSSCYSLIDLNLSGKTHLKKIDEQSFNECSNLKRVDLAGCSSLTEISDLAFNYCKQLTNIDISDCVNLEIIGDYRGCI